MAALRSPAAGGAAAHRDDRFDFRRGFRPGGFLRHPQALSCLTSNIFAILGLRSMYFMLAGALGYFRYLKIGLSFVLAVSV